MSALEDRLRRFAYEWHEAMNSPYAVNMMPLLLEAASDIRSLAATSLEAENAKLRELLRDMNKWLWNGADCTECPFTARCDLNAAFESDLHANICIGWSEIHDRMRDLGVEVDA